MEISAQTIEIWQSFKQLKSGYYNGMCQVTLTMSGATSFVYNNELIQKKIIG